MEISNMITELQLASDFLFDEQQVQVVIQSLSDDPARGR